MRKRKRGINLTGGERKEGGVDSGGGEKEESEASPFKGFSPGGRVCKTHSKKPETYLPQHLLRAPGVVPRPPSCYLLLITIGIDGYCGSGSNNSSNNDDDNSVNVVIPLFPSISSYLVIRVKVCRIYYSG